MGKILIAFYSRRGQNYVNGSIRNLEKGNNEVMVEKILQLLGGDAAVFRIDTVTPYPEDYTATTQPGGTATKCPPRAQRPHTQHRGVRYDNTRLPELVGAATHASFHIPRGL